LRLDPLGGTISPADCKINIKSNSVSLTLRKADADKKWDDILFKPKQKENPADKSKDPKAGLMDMMKKMYNEGDDDTKKSIGEAWTKAQAEGANKKI